MAISEHKGKNRYRSLIIFISLFVLIIVSMLLANFYFSSQFSKDATEINLAGRQRMLSQKQAKVISKLIQAQSSNEGIDRAFKEAKNAYTLFDETLEAFTNGGTTKDALGNYVTIREITKGDARIALAKGNEIWNDYKIAMNKLISSDISSLHHLASATEYARDKNSDLLTSMDQFTKALVINKSSSSLVNLAGRQRMLSQRITKSLFELINSQNNVKDNSQLFVSLKNDTEAFEAALNTFSEGSQALKNKDAQKILDQGIKIWKPLSILISQLLNSEKNIFTIVAKANAYASNDNLSLLSAMNDLTVALEKDQSKRSDLLGYIQIAGIIMALGMFGFIMTFFMKHLKKADDQLDQAIEETDEILSTINDGLFLIDQDHMIGKQHSKSLPKVINVEDPAGENFLSVLGDIVPDKTVHVAKEYLDLLYGDRVHADLVADLNPLDQVEVYFEGDDHEKKLGYLAFDFKRVTKDGNIPHLLVQVEDISNKVILEKQLEETKGAAQEQFDLMLQVLHVQPKVLVQFLEDTDKALNKINSILQLQTRNLYSDNDNADKINSIARFMHRIKGDASGLQLQGFEQKAHEFEDLFATLKNRSNLTGKNFLPVVIKLEEFMKQLGSLRSMIDKLANLKETLKDDQGANELQIDNTNDTKMSTILNILVNSVSARQGKNVILNIFNEHLLPKSYAKPIHDMLTQLVRNSIVHGIEDSGTRQRRNKTNEGVIAIKFFIDSQNNTLSMKYLDNGRGLRSSEIINTAIERGIITKEKAHELSDNEAYSLIFKPGFSTITNVVTDAGRGVGMDIVQNIVQEHNGTMEIKSIIDKVFKIDITLPLPDHMNYNQTEKSILEEA